MNHLTLNLSDSPDKAPVYRAPEFLAATLISANIVGRGTVEGNPTVDLIFQDQNGQKFVAMITGGILQNAAAAVEGMRLRTLDLTAGAH